ncbi:MAG: hypothetical protein ACLVB5_05195 [Christensenellales bacterium]
MARLIGHATDVITAEPGVRPACLAGAARAKAPRRLAFTRCACRLSESGASVLVTSAGDAVVARTMDARTGRRFRVPLNVFPGEHWGHGRPLLRAAAGCDWHSGPFRSGGIQRASDGVYEALLAER